jgi:MSHA pilin protein MshD
MNKRSETSSRRRGFTMVETVICVVIVAVMLVAALEMIGTAARLRGTQTDQSRAAALARELLAEIMQYSYVDPELPTVLLGPELAETRGTFDDVDDYNGLTESPPQKPDGTPLPGFTGWTRSTIIEYADPTNPSATSITDTGLKRISIKVTTPTGRSSKLTALRSKYSAYDKQYGSSSTYSSWVQVDLQLTSDPATRVMTSVNPLNQVP